MNRNLKVKPADRLDSSVYQEIAVYVRELLKCDYALVAAPEQDSIRVLAIAGAGGPAGDYLPVDLAAKLRDWGPIVVDESRLIAVPVSSGGRMLGVLCGYSSKPGTFTAMDLQKLMGYGNAAAAILAEAAPEELGETRTAFSSDELMHLSRLITIGELCACFAHEVNNPLTLIRGHLHFVEEHLGSNHPLKINFEVIDRASRRIEEIAKRMLDFSKKRIRHTESCEVAEIVSDALRFVQPYIRAEFIDVQVQLDPQLPPLEVDRWQIVQTIVNLLQNAVYAMANLDRRILSITARTEGKQMRIVISDTGKGIATSNLSNIFEPFFTTKGEQGTGLGLYITKQVIEDHRGTIDVQTAAGGTSFSISLPLG